MIEPYTYHLSTPVLFMRPRNCSSGSSRSARVPGHTARYARGDRSHPGKYLTRTNHIRERSICAFSKPAHRTPVVEYHVPAKHENDLAQQRHHPAVFRTFRNGAPAYGAWLCGLSVLYAIS